MSNLLTAQQILASINSAKEQAGLSKKKTFASPLAVFYQLLEEWCVENALDYQHFSKSPSLPEGMTLTQLTLELSQIYTEVLRISKVHQLLTQWTERELEQEYQRLLQEINRTLSAGMQLKL